MKLTVHFADGSSFQRNSFPHMPTIDEVVRLTGHAIEDITLIEWTPNVEKKTKPNDRWPMERLVKYTMDSKGQTPITKSDAMNALVTVETYITAAGEALERIPIDLAMVGAMLDTVKEHIENH